jgi:hypothetical protein
VEALHQTEALGLTLQDPHLQSYAAFTTGWIEAMRGASTVGIQACQRGYALATDPVNTAHALGALGGAYLESSDVATARPLLQEAVQHWERFGMQPLQAWFLALWAEAVLVQAEPAQAQELAERSVILAAAVGFPFAVGLAQRVLGRCARRRGALDEARARLQTALETFATIDARFERGRTHLDMAALGQTCGDRAATTHHLTAADTLFQALQVPVYQARTVHMAQACGVVVPTEDA